MSSVQFDVKKIYTMVGKSSCGLSFFILYIKQKTNRIWDTVTWI